MEANQDAALSTPPLSRLAALNADRGASSMATRLEQLEAFVSDDLSRIDEALAAFARPSEGTDRETTRIHEAAFHLLRIPGKYVRPMCVSLAARTGEAASTNAISPEVRDIAVAAELVHNATLLHDDVVDLGETRRGQDTARVVFGNATAVFAGDWLLIRALQLVQGATSPRGSTNGSNPAKRHVPEASQILPQLLQVIEEMIDAEAVQLQHRGTFNMATRDYFRVIEGKTARLFRWACFAGGALGGFEGERLEALERFGHHVGIAFQLTDDALDYEGSPAKTGKAALQDLHEGKATFPLLRALELSNGLHSKLHGSDFNDEMLLEIHRCVEESGALGHCRALAEEHAHKAYTCLDILPATEAKQALLTIAESIANRDT